MFAYTIMSCVQGEHESWAGGLRLVLLAVFNFLCTFLRLNADYSYAGVVAAFTAYVVALGIPDGASTTEARAYAHLRIEQNLLGIVILVFIEVVLLPTFAQDAARRAASEAVAAAEHAAEVIYDATVGTDCISCRDRAAQDAGVSLDDLREKLNALNTLLVQAAAEPHLWSPKFPLEPYQRIATETESVRRVLGLMRAALTAMAQGSRGGSTEGSGDPRRMVRELLSPTDRFVTDLRRAVKQRLGRAAHDLAEGEGHWETKKAAASIARAQASLDRAFILHTLEIRVRFQAGEDDMFLPNHLMVPWHAYMSCTAVLASNVDNLSQASWEALLAVKPPVGDVTEEDWEDEVEHEEPAFSSGGGKYDDDDDDVRPISSSQPSFKRSGSGASGRSGDAPYTNGAGVKSPEQSLGRL
jgi:pimeloyl-ACP methyl ester carboxylesterase